MRRSDDQNRIFHCMCREVAKHLKSAKVENVSETTIKELLKITLGNTVLVLGVKIAMPTSKYKRSEADLSPDDHRRGFISMEGLITKMVVWSSADLGLILKSTEESKNEI